MICSNRIAYTLRAGDNLYHIAKRYNTDVSIILSENPHLNPYNLHIGDVISVCADSLDEISTQNTYQNFKVSGNTRMDLINNMRMVWEQHVAWTRMLLISIAESLKDVEDVTKRLLKNPEDIAVLFKPYYGTETARKIAALITEHLVIGGDLIKALKNGNKSSAEKLNTRWYENADKIADAFSALNPNHYDMETLRRMLHEHLNLTSNEVAMRLAKNYPADIAAYDAVETEALMMADYFSDGIIKQFANKF